MKWQIQDTGKEDAKKNMEVDSSLLKEAASKTSPTLRFYEWEGDALTYGYFLDPFEHLQKDAVEKLGLNLARRPTGGGILFHLTDFTFSILLPASHPRFTVNTLENYAFVNSIVADVIAKFSGKKTDLLACEPTPFCDDARHFCMAKPTQLDVMIEEKKVAGGAQRRSRHGFLHQGTISLAALPKAFLRQTLKNPRVAEAMIDNGGALVELEELVEARQRLKRIFAEMVSASC